MPNPTNITAPRVPLTDPKTGLVSREWYNFFLSLFTLTGSGQPAPSLVTVNAAINTLQAEPTDNDLLARITELAKSVQALQILPPVIPAHPMLTNTATLAFPSTAAQSSSDLTISVPGAVVGDVVGLGVPAVSVLANSNYSAWVSVSNTVNVRFNNYSAAALAPASGLFRVTVTRF